MSFALVRISDGAVLQHFDLAPAMVKWPNGDTSHCPVIGDERGDARLVAAPGMASPATSVGIVYATGSGIVRRVIVPTIDTELDHPSHVGPQEAMLKIATPKVIRRDGYPDLAAARAHVALVTGKPSPSGRCAVVTNGLVTGIIMADPDIDAIPGAVLVLSEVAQVGWTTRGGVLTTPVVASNSADTGTITVIGK